ncbi:MAG TPA: FAD-dependent oxidoreductase, partial [bacterium]|nr:FAD-dependent oxidoreductase [bacterium]
MAPWPRLGIRHLERAEGWGMAVAGFSYVLRPRSVEELAMAFDIARREGRPLALRGAGRSYGDAALNSDGILLDLSLFSRILAWDPATGIIDAEPGLTIEGLWKSCIADGWWPPVVPGTMFATLGGAAAANIHGKNNFAAGPLGEHILEFDLLAPTGELVTCSRTQDTDLFHAAIGSFGALGVFTRLRLQMKRVYSGLLAVEAYPTRHLPEMVATFEELKPESDYLVGWVDCLAGGGALGRGLIHRGLYLPEGVDPEPAETLRVSAQDLPPRILGILPKSLVYLLARPFLNRPGVAAVNAAKYWTSRWTLRGERYRQSHAAFAFLLDYVPNWKWMYQPGGLV